MVVVKFEHRGRSNITDQLAVDATCWCEDRGLVHTVDFYWFYWSNRLCFEFYDYEFAMMFKLAWV